MGLRIPNHIMRSTVEFQGRTVNQVETGTAFQDVKVIAIREGREEMEEARGGEPLVSVRVLVIPGQMNWVRFYGAELTNFAMKLEEGDYISLECGPLVMPPGRGNDPNNKWCNVLRVVPNTKNCPKSAREIKTASALQAAKENPSSVVSTELLAQQGGPTHTEEQHHEQ